jgi:hypothetical protein
VLRRFKGARKGAKVVMVQHLGQEEGGKGHVHHDALIDRLADHPAHELEEVEVVVCRRARSTERRLDMLVKRVSSGSMMRPDQTALVDRVIGEGQEVIAHL